MQLYDIASGNRFPGIDFFRSPVAVARVQSSTIVIRPDVFIDIIYVYRVINAYSQCIFEILYLYVLFNVIMLLL